MKKLLAIAISILATQVYADGVKTFDRIMLEGSSSSDTPTGRASISYTGGYEVHSAPIRVPDVVLTNDTSVASATASALALVDSITILEESAASLSNSALVTINSLASLSNSALIAKNTNTSQSNTLVDITDIDTTNITVSIAAATSVTSSFATDTISPTIGYGFITLTTHADSMTVDMSCKLSWIQSTFLANTITHRDTVRILSTQAAVSPTAGNDFVYVSDSTGFTSNMKVYLQGGATPEYAVIKSVDTSIDKIVFEDNLVYSQTIGGRVTSCPSFGSFFLNAPSNRVYMKFETETSFTGTFNLYAECK